MALSERQAHWGGTMNRIEAARAGHEAAMSGASYTWLFVGLVAVVIIFAVGHVMRERNLKKKIEARRKKLKRG